MASQLMRSTQIACHISLNIVVSDNGNARLVTLPLLPLTGVFFLLWSIRQAVESFIFELATVAGDLQAALNFTAKVLTIGFNVLAFGLGVPL